MPIMSEKTRKVLNEMINDYASGNLVKVVRCKDCGFYVVNELTKKYEIDRRRKPSFCELYGRYRKEDWFCADGEKRVEEY